MTNGERPFPEVEGVRHRFVEAGGVRFHVAEAGPVDAPGDPVLMLHGWPQNWFEWRGVIPHFAQDRRVICPDLRGLGWSDAPPRGYDKETFMRDTVALLDALEVQRVDLIAHDWGAWSGFLLCLFHPERVRRYVALNITPPWPKFSVRSVFSFWRFWYMGMFSLPGIGPAVARAWGRSERAARRRPSRGWDAQADEVFRGQFAEPARARATSQIYRTFLASDLPRALRGVYKAHRLTTPTLLLYGADDQVIRPHNLAGWEPYADDMRVEHVPGITHFIADEAPDLVARRAQEHFA